MADLSQNQRAGVSWVEIDGKQYAVSKEVCERIEAIARVKEAVRDLKQCDIERLRGKLQRVRDWLKFQANADAGIVAEIDGVLLEKEGSNG